MSVSASSSTRRFQNQGVRILGGDVQPLQRPSSQASNGHLDAQQPPSHRSDAQRPSIRTDCRGMPLQTSARNKSNGLLHSSSAPTLSPRRGLAQEVSRLAKNTKMTFHSNLDDLKVWSQNNILLQEEWPTHALPVIVFREQPPHINFKEECRFEFEDEKYNLLAIRMRCGEGDHYGGGAVVLVHSADGKEVSTGALGQMVMVISLVVNRDNSITLRGLGDLRCRVNRTWMPRGFRGLQMAYVDTIELMPDAHSIIEVAENDPELTGIAKLWRSVPALEELLTAPGALTAFAPTNAALAELERRLGYPVERIAQERPEEFARILSCHISRRKVLFGQMYNNRDFEGLEGSLGQISFSQWPRGTVRINGARVSRFDVGCKNGVIHTIEEVLMPGYSAGKRPTPEDGRGGALLAHPTRDARQLLVPQVYY